MLTEENIYFECLDKVHWVLVIGKRFEILRAGATHSIVIGETLDPDAAVRVAKALQRHPIKGIL